MYNILIEKTDLKRILKQEMSGMFVKVFNRNFLKVI